MHGHGYAPPPQRPSTAQLVVLRVIFVILALFSCGFLAWVPLLRLAIVTRTTRNWLLCVASGLVTFLSLLLIGGEPTDALDSVEENLGLFGLFGGAVAAVGYYLYAEIRHFNGPAQQAFVPPQAPPPAYGYPAQPGPAQQVTRPTGMPQGGPHTGPQPPAGAPQPQRPAPARIDQVRAELDELSSLLRDQDNPRRTDEPEGHAEGETR